MNSEIHSHWCPSNAKHTSYCCNTVTDISRRESGDGGLLDAVLAEIDMKHLRHKSMNSKFSVAQQMEHARCPIEILRNSYYMLYSNGEYGVLSCVCNTSLMLYNAHTVIY